MRFIREYTATGTFRVLNAYQTLVRFLRGSYSAGFFNKDKTLTNLTATTPEESLPNELLTKEETTTLAPVTQTITRDHIYPGFLAPYNETQYWRVSCTIKNRFKVKDYSLRGGVNSSQLVLPCRQELSYENPNVQWANANGTPRQNPRSVGLDRIYPKNVTSSNFSLSVISTFSQITRSYSTTRGEVDRQDPITYTEQYYAYVYYVAVLFTGFNSFFNLLRAGSSFHGFNSRIGSALAQSFTRSFTAYEEDNNRREVQVNLSYTTPSINYRKNVYYRGPFFTFDAILLRYSSAPSINRSAVTKSDFDSNTLAQNGNLINNLVSSINNEYINSNSGGGGRSPINIYQARPLLQTDWTTPTNKVTNNDLGFASGNNTISINGVRQTGNLSQSPTAISVPTRGQLNTDGTVFRNFFYTLFSNINLNNIPLISSINAQNQTAPGTNELTQYLPITLQSDGSNTYEIVRIDFANNDIYIQKNLGSSVISATEITALLVAGTTGDLREISIGGTAGSRPGTYNSVPVRIYRSEDLADFFRPMFSQNLAGELINFNGVNIPSFSAFVIRLSSSVNSLRTLFSTTLRRLRFSISAGTQAVTQTETTQNQDLLDNVNKSFPHIRLNNILYNTEENRIYLVLARGENSPVPDKSYFSSVKINRRSFNFSSSRYNAYTNPETSPYGSKVAEYSWSYPTNLLGTAQTIPIQFRKSGTSTTNAIDISRLVRKATVNTKDKKEYTEIINNLFVKDIGFTSTSFYIEFSGDIPTNRFQSIALKSQDNNEYITRQLLTTDATVTEDSGKTKFTWNDKPEFAILSYNKQYTIEMISGANSKEKRLFIPIQSKDNFHFVNNYKQTSGNISFNLQRSTFTDNLSKSFVAMALLKESDNSVISGGWYNSNRFIYDTDRKTFTLENSNIIDSPATGTKVLLSFQIHDRDLTEITLLKLTDIFFDTIICLDTNINDLNLLDNNGNPLAHPSDYETIKEVTEDGLRHIFLKLKQPITTKELKLLVRRTSDDANEIRINRMLVLKSIGCFSQYPEVTVNTNQSKTDESSAINTSHITSKPLSINYTLAFPPLTKEKDLSLAQDLFTRASEYNEFLIWVSGGDIAPKIKNLIGYRFIDIVKSLATNDFSVHYVDGRFSSGVDFTIETKQTARINI